MKTINHYFPSNQYYKEETKKKGIVLHHTVSGNSVAGDINWWKSNPQHVATCVIIGRDGKIHRLFSSKYWAHHLGIKRFHFKYFGLPSLNKKRNKEFIGVELDSWGGLVKRNGKYYSYTGREIDKDNVVYYKNEFRGYHYFEKYTDAQIKALYELLLYWGKYYNIPLNYKGEVMFKYNKRALSGEEGIWAHVSFRPDKSDIHPQEELIKMLKSL
ncbi:N-acetylmuramoyl-L-alanine amidase [Tenacibaculum sp. C7A-26P2]|uniref:N-acetylmuramoyl-L-alanine amidase n=1 Tax=Tenacibaculum sp. C7A-26P2 TaxID=3447504 RepID=UPI003F834C3F